MDGLVLHELPREERKGERRSTPVDRRVDIDALESGDQLPLLVVQSAEQRLASQRSDVVIVLSRPIDRLRSQRVSVNTAHTDDMSQLLAERREAVADPMRRWWPTRSSWRVGRKVPFVVRDRMDKIHRQAMEDVSVPCEVVDRHRAILAKPLQPEP